MEYGKRLSSYQMKPTLIAFACLICVLPAARAAEVDVTDDAADEIAVTAPGPAYARDFVKRPLRAPLPVSWKWSLAPLVASQALDVTSSYGMRELNPVLAGPDGRFGVQAVSMKLGVTAALVGIEYLIVKAHPRSARFFTRINWSGAAVTSSFAVHNFAIR